MPFQHLSNDEIRELTRLALEAGLAEEGKPSALVQGIDRIYMAAVTPAGGDAATRTRLVLGRLNETENLRSGQVPLVEWLDNAVLLTHGTAHATQFQEFLRRIEREDAPSPAAASTPDESLRKLTLEAQIGADDQTLPVAFLLNGGTASNSVGLMKVHRHFNGQPQFGAAGMPSLGRGTCWMVAPGLVVTNHHVVRARAPGEPAPTEEDFSKQAAGAKVVFGYFAEESASEEREIERLVASDVDLDFAILELAAAPADRSPLRLRVNPLTKPAETPLAERVNVLHHPNGKPMRIGFRDNFVVSSSAQSLSYLTDTAYGSSGAPVFDDAWSVAALHRGYRPLAGMGIELRGTPILSENYGVPIGAVLAHLEANCAAVHARVRVGQGG